MVQDVKERIASRTYTKKNVHVHDAAAAGAAAQQKKKRIHFHKIQFHFFAEKMGFD